MSDVKIGSCEKDVYVSKLKVMRMINNFNRCPGHIFDLYYTSKKIKSEKEKPNMRQLFLYSRKRINK